MQTNENHEKIMDVLKRNGPSLPIQVAKQVGLSSLFISAFLSELADEKRIKISNLKVGGSPLYFLEGQEEKLESFYKYLHPIEAEAFFLLKEKKFLRDSEQKPAIRVALRSIRDFSVGFKKDDEIYWRYNLTPETEIIELLEPEKKVKLETPREEPKIIEEVKEKIQERVKEIVPETPREIIKETPKIIKTKPKESKPIQITRVKETKPSKFENPLIIETKKEEIKEKPKSEFVLGVIEKLSKFKILEEKEYKPKEYTCIVQIRSELGIINFLAYAKDKKKISEADLRNILSEAQKIPLPALFLYTGNLSKKAREFAETYYSILKVKKIE